jgi:threonine/homoserine/homoserine lactone efflux protein
LAVGFGMNFLLYTYPNIANTIKYMGILFLLYLAFKFFKMSNSLKETVAPLTFKDGVIVEILNVKYLLIPTIMFSQFYTPQDEDYLQIYMLTFALLALTLTTSMIWILGGKSLAVFVSKKNTQKVQGLLFGTLLCITALWLVIS